MPLTKVRTIREAIVVALEGLPGPATDWVSSSDALKAMRQHVIEFIAEYAEVRGVVLDERKDIIPELDVVVDELRQVAIARAKTPITK